MRLWKLDRVGDTGYDEVLSVVVRARGEAEARELAALAHMDEGTAAWLDRRTSTCEPLPVGGAPGVVIQEYRAG